MGRIIQKISKKRIEKIINGKLIGTYGLGNERDLNDYKVSSGIDIKNKEILNPDNVFKFKTFFKKIGLKKNKKKGFLW